MSFMALRAGARGRLSQVPLLKAWTETRDLPAPQGRTFQTLYARARRKRRL
jgi:L-lactate dehydrogenase complex protein LldF